MGNSAPHRLSDATGKVILSNGAVFTYDMPLTVAELMLEHPQEVVVEFQPITTGKKPTPLPADQKLEMKKLYLMVPIRKGKPALLSSEEARKLLTKTNSFLNSKALLSYTGFLPLFVRICPAVGAKNDAVLMDEKKKKCLVERNDEDGIKSDYFTEVLEGRPEFLSRQISGKGWKPSLDPIREKAIKAKVRHWMF
ncbi:hypothetical protein BUALT_Bualt02G0241400 [Buddleja alternifolia]|uniref:Multidrug resistance protein ABC transporter family protein n=1 Tax=Buddleja alternifolia TaxID=168488 RepID=A0AAV6Y744_9LAMI|nr:hypothetical protein BUALT_Bualt02G0241400 [Buddleja alternifolia]